jgi:hypothetical protein
MDQANNISMADPFEKLAALSAYMNRFIDEWPKKQPTFYRYVKKKCPEIIPGTKEYYKKKATHCYLCKEKLKRGTAFWDPKAATTDHWIPKSKGDTEVYVICCYECNTRKGDIEPAELRRRIIKAIFTGKPMWGYNLRKLVTISDQIEIITNDIIYKTGPEVYYIQNTKKSKAK